MQQRERERVSYRLRKAGKRIYFQRNNTLNTVLDTSVFGCTICICFFIAHHKGRSSLMAATSELANVKAPNFMLIS